MKKHYSFDKNLNLKPGISENKKIKKNNPKEKFLLANYSNIGYYLVTPLLIGVFLGLYFDKVLVGIVIGGMASIYNLFRLLKQ